MFQDEDDSLIRWENEGGYIHLPDDITARMYELTKAVSKMASVFGPLAAEAQNLIDAVDRLLPAVVSLKDDDDD